MQIPTRIGIMSRDTESDNLPVCEKRTQILKCLVEGNSIRASALICDVVKNTVIKLLCEVGEACSKYQDEHLRNLACKGVQCDEIWSLSMRRLAGKS